MALHDVSVSERTVEDLERNDGSAEKPYFMNKELLKILGKKNEKYKDIQATIK